MPTLESQLKARRERVAGMLAAEEDKNSQYAKDLKETLARIDKQLGYDKDVGEVINE